MKPKFINDIMVIFAIDILVIMLLTFLTGEEASSISTIFQLGSQGIALTTLLEFFLSAVVISIWRQVFFSEKIFKNMMTLWRTVWMVLCVIVSICGFIVICGWFPINSVAGWVSFVVTFLICFSASIGVMILKTKWQSRKYENLLEEFKSRKGEEHE